MKNLIVFCLAIIFLASCSTSNNVASNKLIQKRKYKKGWHVNSTQKIEKTANSEEVAYTNQVEPKDESESAVAEEETIVTSTSTISEENEESYLSNEIFDNQNDVAESNYETENNTPDEVLINNEISVQQTSNNQTTNKIENNVVSSESQSSDSDVALILLVILAFILPPLAVFLVRGVGTEFLISLALFLIAIGGGFAFIGGIAGLVAIAGLVYALLIVFDAI